MTPEQKAKLKVSLEELTIEFAKIDMARAVIKDTIDALKEEYDISPRVLRKIARLLHMQNATEEFNKQAEVEELYEELTQ